MDDIIISPQELYDRARAIKLTRKEWCRNAGIAPSTFNRWLTGRNSIKVDNYANLVRTLIEMEDLDAARDRTVRILSAMEKSCG